MSVFDQRLIECPRCQCPTVRTVAVSLHGSRVPEIRRAIADRSFQRVTCPACGERHFAESPFIYIDFETWRWIGVYPRAWEAAWRALEGEPLGCWRRTVAEHAPPSVRRLAHRFQVRAVFGLEALREKLLVLDAGLDDRALAALALRLLHDTPELPPHPAARPVLAAVDGEWLRFVASLPRGEQLAVTVPRAQLAEIAADPAWAATYALVGAGPYVDAGRLMIAGSDGMAAGSWPSVSPR